jgi:aspartate racemase
VREVGQQLVNRGADLIVLACTELPLVCGPDDLGVVVLSSTDELARRTIAVAKGDMPLP